MILATHGHGDHTGDVAELAKRPGATVLGPAGLIATMIDLGWVTPEKGFGDMRLIGDYYKPDLFMIPIGGHFVMDPRDAAYATKEMLKPKFEIPFHYGTFPVLRGTPQEYQAALGLTSTQIFPISPGDKLTF